MIPLNNLIPYVFCNASLSFLSISSFQYPHFFLPFFLFISYSSSIRHAFFSSHYTILSYPILSHLLFSSLLFSSYLIPSSFLFSSLVFCFLRGSCGYRMGLHCVANRASEAKCGAGDIKLFSSIFQP